MKPNLAFRQNKTWTAIFVFTFCLVTIAASRGMGETYGIFLLPITETFGWPRANITSIYSVYMVSFGIGSLISGILFDRYGPRANYTIGFILLAVSYWFAGQLNSIIYLYAILGVCGGGGAALVGIVPAQSLLSKCFPQKRATAIAFAYAGQGVGIMLLAPAAQLAIEYYQWRLAYQLAGYGFLAILLISILIPWNRLTKSFKASKKCSNFPFNSLDSKTNISLIEALKLPEFWGFFTIFFTTAISIFSISLQTVAYLISVGFNKFDAAFAFGTVGMVTIIGITFTGILAEKFPPYIVASMSYGLTFIGISTLAILQFFPNWFLLTTFVISFGLSAGARGPIITAQMAKIFAGKGLASIFGATSVGNGCGAAIGAFLSGVIFDITGGYNFAFLMSFCFSLIGLSIFWLIPAIKNN